MPVSPSPPLNPRNNPTDSTEDDLFTATNLVMTWSISSSLWASLNGGLNLTKVDKTMVVIVQTSRLEIVDVVANEESKAEEDLFLSCNSKSGGWAHSVTGKDNGGSSRIVSNSGCYSNGFPGLSNE